MVKVLFVCTGNICRSPTAEGVFRKLLDTHALDEVIHTDSAGTDDYHVGEPPDFRSSQAALKRGYDLSPLRARQLEPSDYEHYDYLLAMTRSHYNHMIRQSPEEHHEKIRMFLDFAHNAPETEVPDPYYGGEQGFDYVLELVEMGCDGLLTHIREIHLESV